MQMYSLLVFGEGHSIERKTIPETVSLIERWELFIPNWYPDGTKEDESILYSCCFGHAEGGDHDPKTMVPGQTFTIEEGREILANDIKTKSHWVDVRVKVPITTYMFGALTSLAFQYGQGRIDESGLVIPKLNEGKYVQAAIEMLQLNKTKAGDVLNGLTVRRACEIAFFMTKK